MTTLLALALPALAVRVIAAQPTPPAPAASYVLPLLVALVSGAGSGWFAIWYRQRKLGDQEREEIISRASKQVVEGAEVLLQQYREDLAEARLAIGALSEQLKTANKRIDELEMALAGAQGDRDRLAKELDDAHERRGRMVEQMDQLKQRVHDLEGIVGKQPVHDRPRNQL